jgi:hypothetical protein
LANFKLQNIKITGIAAATPKNRESNWDYNFSSEAEKDCKQASYKYPHIKEFIEQLLGLDHRAYYYKKIDKTYSTKVYDYDLKWAIKDNEVIIKSLKDIS